jgi:peptidoglycan/LPS O-acetylase OafA/YrhL
MVADPLRRRAFAAALTLASGALMVLAGYVADTESVAFGLVITIPAGPLILAALALARGAPPASAAALAAALLSGGVMFLAGYAGSAWAWWLAPPLATFGGLVIAVAFAVDRSAEKSA